MMTLTPVNALQAQLMCDCPCQTCGYMLSWNYSNPHRHSTFSLCQGRWAGCHFDIIPLAEFLKLHNTPVVYYQAVALVLQIVGLPSSHSSQANESNLQG